MKMLNKLVCLAAVIGMVMISWGCKEKIEPGHTSPKETRVIQAPVAVAQTGNQTEHYEAVATIAARVYADLSSKLMGTVLEVRVEEGDPVREGDALVIIDSRQVTAGLEQAQAALEEAMRAEASAESAKDAVKAAAELAEITHERYKRLLKEESATRQEFDEAQARHRQAQAALAQAAAMLAGARNRVQQSKAAVKSAAVSQKDAVIHAPYPGRITRKRVHAGDLASPGMPLISIEKEGSFRAEVDIPEKYMKNINLKQQVSVTIPALDSVPFIGVVSQIIPSADAKSRSFRVKVDLPQREGVRSGMFARVAFSVGTFGMLAIPKKAVISQGQLSGVFVLDETDIARFRLVKTGKEFGDAVEVLSGLKEGIRYVSDPPPALEDGMKVETRS